MGEQESDWKGHDVLKKKKKESETAVKQKRRKNRIPGRRALVIPSGGDVRFL